VWLLLASHSFGTEQGYLILLILVSCIKGILSPLNFLWFLWRFYPMIFWRQWSWINGSWWAYLATSRLYPTYILQMIIFCLLSLRDLRQLWWKGFWQILQIFQNREFSSQIPPKEVRLNWWLKQLEFDKPFRRKSILASLWFMGD